MHRVPPLALVAVATMLFAFKSIIARVAFDTGLTVLGLVVLRVAFATPLYLVVSYALRHRQQTKHARRRDYLEAFAAGAFFLMAAACDFAAISRIGPSASRVILFSFPGIVITIEAVLRRRWPPSRQLFIFAIAWLGLSMVAAPDGFSELEGTDLSGALYALGGSITYAIFLTAGHRSMQRLGSIRFTGVGNAGTATALLIALPFIGTEADFTYSTEAILWLLLMATACTVFPFFLLAEGVGRAGASRASLITLIGPPTTVLAAFLLIDERLRPIQLVGTALVLGAVSFLKRQPAPLPPPPPETERPQSVPAAPLRD